MRSAECRREPGRSTSTSTLSLSRGAHSRVKPFLAREFRAMLLSPGRKITASDERMKYSHSGLSSRLPRQRVDDGAVRVAVLCFSAIRDRALALFQVLSKGRSERLELRELRFHVC